MLNGFISYAHADMRAFEQIRRGLITEGRALGIEFWTDKHLHTGMAWDQKIGDAIASAEVFVAVVSYESLYSQYIWEHELPAMKARSASTGALILPLIVNRCSWDYHFGGLHVAPLEDGRVQPILDWKPQRNGFAEACRQAGDAIRRYYNLPAAGSP